MACTAADLITAAEVRDATGAACTTCPASSSLSVVGIVANPCSMDVDFVTLDSCLASQWEVTSASGMGMAMVKSCAGVVTHHTVPAGGTVESVQSWGRMSRDSYRLMVYFDDPARSTAGTAFAVH